MMVSIESLGGIQREVESAFRRHWEIVRCQWEHSDKLVRFRNNIQGFLGVLRKNSYLVRSHSVYDTSTLRYTFCSHEHLVDLIKNVTDLGVIDQTNWDALFSQSVGHFDTLVGIVFYLGFGHKDTEPHKLLLGVNQQVQDDSRIRMHKHGVVVSDEFETDLGDHLSAFFGSLQE
ncbi:hypothetical protein OGAPHI_000437 [Ogataea philodendri]|uniref:Uncharacterized protein n=1 Tax=Ogataea philodendri TaxID=1378263 RepID=A0A9P8PGR3_9ASCO|nr:uncharacterized protein OGAPHI_000437 [Ogataea philodendri]KAH3671732.1 hypothetical protein OGAPHI_000437 [Ogataea philodendri]